MIAKRIYCLSLLTGLIGLLIFLYVWMGFCDSSSSKELRLLADAPARVVWCRQKTRNTRDVWVRGSRFQLMGFCSEDRRGERVIMRELGNYHKPMLTADGRRVVYTDAPSRTIYAVNFDGTGLRELTTGVAEDVWRDPQTGIEWVYSLPNSHSVREPTQGLIRFQLDNPAIEERVWDETQLSSDGIQSSADGAFVSVQYPHPLAGVLDVAKGVIRSVGRGCWISISPDNSYLVWAFDGSHRNLIFHGQNGNDRWVVNINGAPGLDGHDVYHPRWSNQTRFMCMSGPYQKGLFETFYNVHIYVGRFNDMLTEVESWVQLTDSKMADFYPDLWVKPKKGHYDAPDMRTVGVLETEKIAGERLTVSVKLEELTLVPSLKEIAPYTQTLVVYRYEVIDVLSGHYDRPQILVAHWGIIDRKRTDLQMQVGDTVELELEPYSNRDELEGERLVMELSDMQHPLFYDVKGR